MSESQQGINTRTTRSTVNKDSGQNRTPGNTDGQSQDSPSSATTSVLSQNSSSGQSDDQTPSQYTPVRDSRANTIQVTTQNGGGVEITELDKPSSTATSPTCKPGPACSKKPDFKAPSPSGEGTSKGENGRNSDFGRFKQMYKDRVGGKMSDSIPKPSSTAVTGCIKATTSPGSDSSEEEVDVEAVSDGNEEEQEECQSSNGSQKVVKDVVESDEEGEEEESVYDDDDIDDHSMPKGPKTCEYCHKVLTTPVSYKDHITGVHGMGPSVLCLFPDCNYRSINWFRFSRHMSTHGTIADTGLFNKLMTQARREYRNNPPTSPIMFNGGRNGIAFGCPRGVKRVKVEDPQELQELIDERLKRGPPAPRKLSHKSYRRAGVSNENSLSSSFSSATSSTWTQKGGPPRMMSKTKMEPETEDFKLGSEMFGAPREPRHTSSDSYHHESYGPGHRLFSNRNSSAYGSVPRVSSYRNYESCGDPSRPSPTFGGRTSYNRNYQTLICYICNRHTSKTYSESIAHNFQCLGIFDSFGDRIFCGYRKNRPEPCRFMARTPDEYRNHIRIHYDVDLFTCGTCDRGFYSETLVQQHVLTCVP